MPALPIDTAHGRFMRNIGWIGMSEIASRASRLITVIVLARLLSTEDYGVAAIALTTNELVKVLSNTGIGQRIIQSESERLDQTCNTAWRMNWVICGALFLLQAALAPLVAWFYDQPQITGMIIAMGCVYLMMPLGLVQCFLVQRASRMKVVALVAASQMTVDNLLTAALVAGGLGVWGVVLPKLLVGPIWVIGMRLAHPWSPGAPAQGGDWRGIAAYGRSVLGVEILKTLRLHADRIILGAALGVEALGLYFFAFSAGLGLSMAFVNSFGAALFPHLCEARGNHAAFRARWLGAQRLAAMVAVPVIALQACLSPWYVPLVYGERWAEAVPLLALLCLSAIPRPFAEGAGQLLRAVGQTDQDLAWNTFFTMAYLGAIACALPWGVTGVAIAVLAVHWTVLPLMTLWVAHRHLPARSVPNLAVEAAK